MSQTVRRKRTLVLNFFLDCFFCCMILRFLFDIVHRVVLNFCRHSFQGLAGAKQQMISDFQSLPCDAALQKVLGISDSTFNFSDLPKLLVPHLFPLAPLTIEHKIK